VSKRLLPKVNNRNFHLHHLQTEEKVERVEDSLIAWVRVVVTLLAPFVFVGMK
jgi:hypothetical protein